MFLLVNVPVEKSGRLAPREDPTTIPPNRNTVLPVSGKSRQYQKPRGTISGKKFDRQVAFSGGLGIFQNVGWLIRRWMSEPVAVVGIEVVFAAPQASLEVVQLSRIAFACFFRCIAATCQVEAGPVRKPI